MHQLLLATRNAHKTREFAQILGPDFTVHDVSERTDLPEVEESGKTFEANAILKAQTISRLVTDLVVADDSGLAVEALGGAPGVYSARYAGEQATDRDNLAKLLAALETAKVAGEAAARFHCVLAIARDGIVLATFHGVIRGVITRGAKGNGGFGYDPVFRPAGSEQTFGEMDAQAKSRISHRAAAIRQLRAYIETGNF